MKHEPILYGFKNTGAHKFYGDRKQTTVWEYAKPGRNMLHPTMKPVALMAYPIRMSSVHDNIVLDLFGGSGATLIAADQLNRIAYLMELDIRYVSAIVRRYISMKGGVDDVYVIRNGEKHHCLDVYDPASDGFTFREKNPDGKWLKKSKR